MGSHPLVSVICLCYNHAQFVSEAIHSVVNQDYPNIELIVVDDGSVDGSVIAINKVLGSVKMTFQTIYNKQNQGNCKSFNQGLGVANGQYIIDLAADDVLLPHRVSTGVNRLEQLDNSYGVHYGSAEYIDVSGKVIPRKKGILPEKIQGDIYRELITTYWINPASMMTKKEVLNELNGYNEALSYEDFDFWIRSSRNWKYAFTDEVLVQKRELDHSLGKQQSHWRNKHQHSTFKVCKTIQKLNRNKAENKALKKRIRYEIRQCLKAGNIGLIAPYCKLLMAT